ncbi:MAG: tetratricopeptide (TPR) repeat protein [Gammaproteobacteria bacterium]|jgi:tetratricopeptide (TPR) repeat protein
MSLLMDALRKAEADKKQALSTATGDDAATRELHDVEDETDLAATIAKPGTSISPAAYQNRPTPISSEVEEMSLEPLDADRPKEEASLQQSSGPSIIESADPNSTMPNTRELERELGAYFDNTSERGFTDPLAATAGDVFVADPTDSGIRETVASPHTIFEAGSSGPSKRMLLWGAALTVVVGCVFSAAGFYYFQQAPTTHFMPSPSVATDIEKPPARNLPIVVPGSAPSTEAGLVVSISDPIAQEIVEQQDLVADELMAEIETFEAHTDAQATPFEPDFLPQEEEIEPAAKPRQTNPDTQRFDDSANSAEIGVRVGELRIARSGGTAEVDSIMKQAYAAYVARDYSTAQSLYDKVLSRRPQHRDALLGVAAMELRNGNVSTAHQHYRDVLTLDPNNATASAALFSLEAGEGDQITESRLKLLLDDGVDVGYVYFSLGNLYARHSRWPDAQQAYFEALRNNPSNPDYNYNLAISLDRIGQRQAAAKYYQAAIGFSDGNQAGFDTANALSRVQAISSALAQ